MQALPIKRDARRRRRTRDTRRSRSGRFLLVADPGEKVAGVPATLPPLHRDPREFPFGVLLVAPGLFEGVSGFSWFASEAEVVEYLRDGMWPAVELDSGRKRACMQLFQAVLSGTDRVSQELIGRLGEVQEEVVILWTGTFQGIVDGSEEAALKLLEAEAEQVGDLELLRSPDGLLHLMAGFRWEFDGGVERVRGEYASLSQTERQRFLAALKSAGIGALRHLDRRDLA